MTIPKTAHAIRRSLRIMLALLPLILACGAFCPPAQADHNRVLFISSYHPSFPTFFRQINGLKSVFDTSDITLDVEFMDSKRFQYDEKFTSFYQALETKISKLPPYDIVLTADDNALNFALMYRDILFPNTPLIFFGVNNQELALSLNEDKNTTGVIESVSMRDTLDVIWRLLPETNTVYAVVDSTPSGRGDLKTYLSLRARYPEKNLSVVSLEDLSWDEAQRILGELPENSALLLLSAYRDKNGEAREFSSALHWILNNSKLPLFHLWYHGLGDGIVGGKLISQFMQGKIAATLALDVLYGRKISDIPVVEGDSANVYTFDAEVLKKYNIDPALVPEGSTVINQKPSIFTEYGKELGYILVVFIILVIAILALLFLNRKFRMAELRARRGEKKYRTYVDNSPVGIFILDAAGRLIEVNAAACAMLGGERENLLTMRLHEVVGEGFTATFPSLVRRLEKGESVRDEWQFTNSWGTHLDVLVDAVMLDEDRFMAYCQDITERKTSERTILRESTINRTLAIVAERLTMPELDYKEIAREVHRHTLALTGSSFGYVASIDLETGNLIGHTLDAMSGECRSKKEQTIFRPGHNGFEGLYGHTLNTLEAFYTNVPSSHPASKGVPEGHIQLRQFLSVPALYKGRLYGQIALANPGRPFTNADLSVCEAFASLFAMALFRKYNEKELLDARDRAEAANRAKSEFLANMSHEIRTPLNGIAGMLQLVKTGELSDEQKEYVDTALESGRRLTHLLSDILDLSRVEAGKLEINLEVFDFHDTLDAVVQLFTPIAREKGLELKAQIDTSIPKLLRGDGTRLQQVLTNLIGNAVKFTPEGHVELSAQALSPLRENTWRILFTVSDTGIGMSPEVLHKIFTPFTQAEGSYQREFQGAGLGLTITKRLVQLMKGSMAVDTAPGEGATFYVSLTYELSTGQEKPFFKDQLTLPRPTGSVLLAEDDPVSRTTTSKLLEHAGYKVRTAKNGKEALELLRSDAFDVVLMDIQMPVLDGVKATMAIREGEAGENNSHVPIIALTAYAMTGEKEDFFKAGMDAHLSKPVTFETLKKTLSSFVRT